MRADCLLKGRAALLVGAAAVMLVACGSSKKSGSKLHAEGGAGTAGSGGVATGGTGGTAGQGGAAGQGGTGGQATGGTGGATNCSDFGNNATCTSCLEKNCCAESAACSADANCKAFIACNKQCPDPLDSTSTCFKNCANQNNPGSSYNPLLQCLETKCTTPVCNYM